MILKRRTVDIDEGASERVESGEWHVRSVLSMPTPCYQDRGFRTALPVPQSLTASFIASEPRQCCSPDWRANCSRRRDCLRANDASRRPASHARQFSDAVRLLGNRGAKLHGFDRGLHRCLPC